MTKNNELATIINNFKYYFKFYISLNILIISFFFYFYNQTKDLKSEYISIKLVTDDFPTIDNMLQNLKSYIEFSTEYKLNVATKQFSSQDSKKIDANLLENYINSYIQNYHQNIISLQESIKNVDSEQGKVSAIEFYFEQIKPFDKIYKLSDPYYTYKYKPINYLTIIFSLFVFLNFFMYISLLFINYIKKIK